MQSRLKIIDIGHSGYNLDKAISELEYNVNLCLENGNFRAIKVIHGHGTGALKKEVREWCNYNEGRFRSIIYGEDYDLFDKKSAEMRADCGSPYDNDLGAKNSAITYIWLR